MATKTKKERLPGVEILSKATEVLNQPVSKGVNENAVDLVGNAKDAVKVFAGKSAFRVYDAGTEMIGKNSIGTLQGMVKSADARAVFNVVSEVGEKIEIIAFLAGLADNIKKSTPEFEAVWASDDTRAQKAIQFTRLAHAIANRTAVGVVTAGVGTIYDILKGWCLIGGLAGGEFQSSANKCVDVLEDAKLLVDKVGTSIADFGAAPVSFIVEIKLGQRTLSQQNILPQRRR